MKWITVINIIVQVQIFSHSALGPKAIQSHWHLIGIDV